MNLKELLDYTDGYTINTRLTGRDGTTNGYQLGGINLDSSNSYKFHHKSKTDYAVLMDNNYKELSDLNIYNSLNLRDTEYSLGTESDYNNDGSSDFDEADIDSYDGTWGQGDYIYIMDILYTFKHNHDEVRVNGGVLNDVKKDSTIIIKNSKVKCYYNDYWYNYISNNLNAFSASDNPSFVSFYKDPDPRLTIKGKMSFVKAIGGFNKGGTSGNYGAKTTCLWSAFTSSHSYWTDLNPALTVGLTIAHVVLAVVTWGVGNLVLDLITSLIKVSKPTKNALCSLAALGILYYFKPYIDDKGKLCVSYKFYFNDDDQCNYHPYKLNYRELKGFNTLEWEDISGTITLSYNKKTKKYEGSEKYLLIKDHYKLKLKMKLGPFKVGHKKVTGDVYIYLTINISYDDTDKGVIVVNLLPKLKGTFKKYHDYPVLFTFGDPESKALIYMNYGLIDVSDKDDPVLVNNALSLFVLDNYFRESTVSGFFSKTICDPLDSIDDAHLDRSHYRGEFSEFPDDLFPLLLSGDIVRVNGSYYLYDGTDWIDYSDDGLMPSVLWCDTIDEVT